MPGQVVGDQKGGSRHNEVACWPPDLAPLHMVVACFQSSLRFKSECEVGPSQPFFAAPEEMNVTL